MVEGEEQEEDAVEEEEREEPGELRDAEHVAEGLSLSDSMVPPIGLSSVGPERFRVATDSSDQDASWSYRGSARGPRDRRMSPSVTDTQLADMRREQMELHRRFAEKEHETRRLQAENQALKAEMRRAKAMEAMVGRLHEHHVSLSTTPQRGNDISEDPLAETSPEEGEIEGLLRRRVAEAEERSRASAKEVHVLQEKVKSLEQELLALKRPPQSVHLLGPPMPEPTRRLSTGSQQRRLLQMDSIAARLHEELRRRDSGASVVTEEVVGLTPQSVAAHEGGDKSPSQSSYYAASVASDATVQRAQLDRQIKAFSRRFVTLRDMR